MSIQQTRDTLISVAKLYYIGNMNQNDIAELMGTSRPKISRMLKMARDKKIVQFQITTPESHYLKLQEKIAEAFELGKVLVTPTETSFEIMKMNVCKTAAEYLSTVIKDGDSLGIVWGSTTSGMIQFMRDRRLKGSKVYQLCGGLASLHLYLDGHETTKLIAKAINAKHFVLNAPFMVNSGLMKSLLLQEPEIKKHFEAFENLDIAVVGMGSSDPAKSLTYLADYITLEESKELVKQGYAADVVGYRLDKDGSMADIPLNERVISIGLDTLRNVPNVIAVACGEDKVSSIITAVKGKYINTLVIDEIAALAIVNKLAL